MTKFSYHASHEQFSPRLLLEFARSAEAAGFDGVFSSDHLQPWSSSQGNAGFSWSWLGAALASTRRISFATITVPGGWRYHPAVIAQATATLADMFPGRFPWVAVGSGEAANEALVGQGWPSKEERNARLRRGAEMLAALLRGVTVSSTKLPGANEARIWVRPPNPVPIIGAALTDETAGWMGSWADGLLTAGVDVGAVKARVDAFHRGGGIGKPLHLKVDISFGKSDALALEEAYRHWRFALIPGSAKADLQQPEEFMEAARTVSVDDVASQVIAGSDPNHFVERITKLAAIGFDTIDIHNVGLNQGEFIDVFGREVLPELWRTTGTMTDVNAPRAASSLSRDG